jgi:hypothetical protein
LSADQGHAAESGRGIWRTFKPIPLVQGGETAETEN